MSNVLMLLDKDYPSDPRVKSAIMHLDKSGESVHLFCLTNDKKRSGRIVADRAVIHRHYMPKIIYKLSALAHTFPFYRFFLQKSVERLTQRIVVGKVYVHDMRIAEVPLRIQALKDLVKVLDLHEDTPSVMPFYRHVKTGLGKLLIHPSTWQRKLIQFITEYDKIVVVTPEAKQMYIERTGVDPSKIEIRGNWIHPDFMSEQSHNEDIIGKMRNKRNILYIGDTGERRGLITAIQAMVDLPEDVRLIIVGESSYDLILKKLVIGLDLNHRVMLEGFVSYNLLGNYLRNSLIGICPLVRCEHHDTTLANKLDLYRAYGLQLLVSDCPAQANFVIKNKLGLVHQADSVDDFKLKVLKLLNDQ